MAGMLDLVMNSIGSIPIRMETKVDFGLLRSTTFSESASEILGFLPELAQETQHCLGRCLDQPEVACFEQPQLSVEASG